MAGQQGGMGWGARLLIAFALILVGAAAATWGLARSEQTARLLGVADSPPPVSEPQATEPARLQRGGTLQPTLPDSSSGQGRIAALEQRLSEVEDATQRVEGSAGRADNLLIAAAARRAIDRGVALGYLERLLVERFGARHRGAVATIVTGARDPVRLNDLIAGYEALGPELRRGGPEDNWWAGLKHELGSIVQVHSAKRPSLAPNVRFERALRRLQAGDVDEALAETMRMPGADQAGVWVAEARRYIAVHRALDEIESVALMPRPAV
ncbi:MAG: hypothetical protein ABIS23_06705 [Sphingomicrobium sp.]